MATKPLPWQHLWILVHQLAKVYLHAKFEVSTPNGFDISFRLQAEKQLELQLFKLFHNERDIDDLQEEKGKKERALEKEHHKRDKIEDEIKEKKKEHGKLMRELTKIEQGIKESVGSIVFKYQFWIAVMNS